MARQASAWAGTKISRLQVLHLVQGGEAGLHVDEEGDMMLGKRRFTGKAVGKADGAVRRPEASHVKGVAWQGEALPARPQRLRLQRLDLAFLGHEELAAQVAGRIVPVEESRLPKRVARKRALYAAGIDAASGLALEAAVSADTAGMGEGDEYGLQLPAPGIEELLDLPARVLVAPAAYQRDFIAFAQHHANLGWALNVEAAAGGLHQFVHGNAFLCLARQDGTRVEERGRKAPRTSAGLEPGEGKDACRLKEAEADHGHDAAHDVVHHDAPACRKPVLRGLDGPGLQDVEKAEKDEGAEHERPREGEGQDGYPCAHELVDHDLARILPFKQLLGARGRQ